MRFTVVSILLFASGVRAQVAPAIAQVTETTQVVSSADVTATHTRTGNYFRRVDGAALTEWLTLDGATGGGTAFLSIPASNVTYQLNLSNNTGTAIGGAAEPVIAPKETSPANLPHITVAGIACTIYPVRPKNSASSGASAGIGQTCVSDQYGLVLMRDLTYVGRDGQTRHEHYQITALQLNTSPAAALFDLTAFKIQ